MTLADLLPVLQMSVAPATLVAGIGLLLLCMTQRFSRVVERARGVALSMPEDPGSARDDARRQLYVLSRRARILRGSVGLATASVLLAVILLAVLVGGAVAGVDAAPAVIGLLITALFTLLLSLGLFLVDVDLSLNALWIELPPGFTLPEERPFHRPVRRAFRLPLNA